MSQPARPPVAESATAFKAAFEAMPVNAVLLLPDAPFFTVVNATEAFLRDEGRNKNDLTGLTFFDLVEDDVDNTLRKSFEEVLDSGRTQAVSMQTSEKGSLKISNKPIISGGNIHFILHLREEAKVSTGDYSRAADPIRPKPSMTGSPSGSESLLSTALELAELATWQFDIRTGVITYSHRANSWWGCSGNSATFDEIVECIHPDDRSRVRGEMKLATEKSGFYKTECRLLNRITKVQRQIQAVGKTIYDEAGSPIFVSGIVRDVTLHKETQRELARKVLERTRELERSKFEIELATHRLVAIFNNVQCAIFTLEPVFSDLGSVVDFRFVVTNPAFASYVGQSPETLKGDLASTWFPGYMQNGVFDMSRDTFLTGNTRRMDVHYHVDGHNLYLDLLSTKAGNEVVVAFTDHTALKNAELKMVDYIRELKTSNEELEQFTYAASHDMQEPLRKISTFCSILLQDAFEQLDDRSKEYLMKIDSSIRRMRKIINDLLRYSQLTEHSEPFQSVDLKTIISEIQSDLEVMISEKSAIVTSGDLPTIYGVPHQVNQLFYNLLSNSIKFCCPDRTPEISVNVSEVDEHFISTYKLDPGRRYKKVIVCDNGIGFHQDYSSQIFNLFTRLNNRNNYDGSGIGLTLCKRIVENHGGVIFAESVPGEGSKFHIVLAVVQ